MTLSQQGHVWVLIKNNNNNKDTLPRKDYFGGEMAYEQRHCMHPVLFEVHLSLSARFTFLKYKKVTTWLKLGVMEHKYNYAN